MDCKAKIWELVESILRGLLRGQCSEGSGPVIAVVLGYQRLQGSVETVMAGAEGGSICSSH